MGIYPVGELVKDYRLSRFIFNSDDVTVTDTIKGELVRQYEYKKDRLRFVLDIGEGKYKTLLPHTLMILSDGSDKILEFEKKHGVGKFYIIHHIDGCMHNNNNENLKLITQTEHYATYRETHMAAQPKGKFAYNHRSRDNRFTKPVAMLDIETGHTVGVFISSTLAAEGIGCNSSAQIKSIASHITSAASSYNTGTRSSAYGFDWKYLENIHIVGEEGLSSDAKLFYSGLGYNV